MDTSTHPSPHPDPRENHREAWEHRQRRLEESRLIGRQYGYPDSIVRMRCRAEYQWNLILCKWLRWDIAEWKLRIAELELSEALAELAALDVVLGS
jgi:hypothetical protein